MQSEDKLVNKVALFFVLPCFLVTFIYFGFSRLLFKRLKLVTSDVIDVKAGKLYVSDMSGYQEYSFDESHALDGGEHLITEERMDFEVEGSMRNSEPDYSATRAVPANSERSNRRRDFAL